PAQKYACLYIKNRISTRFQYKAIRTGSTWRIKQGIEHHLLVLRCRTFNPEFSEMREFFGLAQATIDRQATCRQTIHLPLANHAEVTGPEHTHDLVFF